MNLNVVIKKCACCKHCACAQLHKPSPSFPGVYFSRTGARHMRPTPLKYRACAQDLTSKKRHAILPFSRKCVTVLWFYNILQNFTKWTPLGEPLEPLWRPRGACGLFFASLGLSLGDRSTAFGVLGSALGLLWARFGAAWGCLGLPLRSFGLSSHPFDRFWGPWVALWTLVPSLWAAWGCLGRP